MVPPIIEIPTNHSSKKRWKKFRQYLYKCNINLQLLYIKLKRTILLKLTVKQQRSVSGSLKYLPFMNILLHLKLIQVFFLLLKLSTGKIMNCNPVKQVYISKELTSAKVI